MKVRQEPKPWSPPIQEDTHPEVGVGNNPWKVLWRHHGLRYWEGKVDTTGVTAAREAERELQAKGLETRRERL